MNELGWDLDSRYVSTKFDCDRRRIDLRESVSGLSRSKWLISSLSARLTSYVSHEQIRPGSYPQVRPYQVWPQSEKNCTQESVNRLSSSNN